MILFYFVLKLLKGLSTMNQWILWLFLINLVTNEVTYVKAWWKYIVRIIFTFKFHRQVSFPFCLRDALLQRVLSFNKILLQIDYMSMVNYWKFITSFGNTFAIYFTRNLWLVNIIDKHFRSFKETLNILYCAPGDLFLDNPNSEITSRGRRNPELIGAISR